MEADIRWLDDPKVFRVGQLPAHSDHPIYQDTEEAAEGRSSLVQSLDGNWEFAYSVNALDTLCLSVIGRITLPTVRQLK